VPLKRDRVSEGIYVFTSGLYAEVTATVVFGDEGAVVVDTMPFPQETQVMVDFISRRHSRVLYVINTHSHADHTYGTCLFPEAEVVAHYRCRRSMERFAEDALVQARVQTPALSAVTVRLPELLFNETLTLRLEGRTIELNYSPGHSRDSISVYVHEDRLMIAGDTVMPVPAIVGGDLDDMVGSLTAMKQKNMENLVQGHGDVLLRGEIEETLDANIHYLRTIDRLVRESIARGVPRSGLGEITIEDCGLSRIPLGGIAVRLHQGNLLSLYDTYRSEMKSRRLA
jgi:cyclase